jgi:hypothetical protein
LYEARWHDSAVIESAVLAKIEQWYIGLPFKVIVSLAIVASTKYGSDLPFSSLELKKS